jgi:adenylosuccinate synthase
MATILDMVKNRLPDEAALFVASLGAYIEEAIADAGYEGTAEADLSTRQKSLVADMAARALITPAMSRYKKDLEEAEGDGAGKAKFADKLKFLQEMKKDLEKSIADRKAALSTAADAGIPMIVVE